MARIFKTISTLAPVFSVIGVLLAASAQATAFSPLNAAWLAPQSVTLRQIAATANPSAPRTFSNIDCTPTTYRRTGSKHMEQGCLARTGFGLMSSGNTVIYNGTDESVKLMGNHPSETLMPWPSTMAVLSLKDVGTGNSSYLRGYSNGYDVVAQRNSLGVITSKTMRENPDILFKDFSGNTLMVHPSVTAFSSDGGWMVVEGRLGYFARIDFATRNLKAFSSSIVVNGIAGTRDTKIAVSDNGRFVALFNKSRQTFRVHDLTSCSGVGASERCAAYDYWPELNKQIGSIKSLNSLRFIGAGLLSFEIKADAAEKSGKYLLAPTDKIDHLTDYIALGDSFTSGEGAFNYRTGTDTPENMCHSSVHAYPALLAKDIFTPSSGHSVACSGARMQDIGNSSGSYSGQVMQGMSYDTLKNNGPNFLNQLIGSFTPGYIAQYRFVQTYQPRVITASVGGNDIGFGEIVRKCVNPLQECYSTYEDRQELLNLINNKRKDWVGLFTKISNESPLSTIYTIGYPDIASPDGKCDLSVPLSHEELVFTRDLIRQLNSVIEQASIEARVNYVDVTDALVGHRLCEARGENVAMNGLTAGTDAGAFGVMVLGKESFHPNALGHRLIKKAILSKTNRLKLTGFGLGTPVNNPDFINKPVASRTINTLAPARMVTNDVVKAGDTVKFSLSGASVGLVPNSFYDISWNYSKQPLARLQSDEMGSIEGELSLPNKPDQDSYVLTVAGPNQNNTTTIATQVLYIKQVFAAPKPQLEQPEQNNELEELVQAIVNPSGGQSPPTGLVGSRLEPLGEVLAAVASKFKPNTLTTSTVSGGLEIDVSWLHKLFNGLVAGGLTIVAIVFVRQQFYRLHNVYATARAVVQ